MILYNIDQILKSLQQTNKYVFELFCDKNMNKYTHEYEHDWYVNHALWFEIKTKESYVFYLAVSLIKDV